jgi:hypothetical protein
MRRVFGDAMISFCALLLLLVTLVSIDPRVREQMSGVFNAPLTTVSAQVREVSTVVFSAAQEQSIANAPLMIFALVATVLVLFMLRT